MLSIRVLGWLAVEGGDPVESISLPSSRRARELLAYLCTHPGRHPRSGLAARFWPDVPEVSARSSLRGALAELRRSLGPEADLLQATRDTIGLAEGQVWVDALAFQRLVTERRWLEALALDRGRLLAEIEADWAERLRQEHADTLANVLGAAADAQRAAGQRDEAVALARRRVRLDPLSEVAARQLIRLLADAGDRPGAVEVGRVLTERLHRELGVRPTAETVAVLTEVRRLEPAPAAVAAVAEHEVSGPTAPHLAELAPQRLVGRGEQLRRLRSLRLDARPRTILLRGEAGIGKTSLAVEAAREAADDGARVLYGRSDEEGIVPFCAWIEALNPAVDGLDPDHGRRLVAEGGEQLRRWFPQLPHHPDGSTGSEPTGASTEDDRWRLFEAITRLLVRLAAKQPLLLVIEDVHWADRSTLLLLRHVVRTTQAADLTVIATTRTPAADLSVVMQTVLAQLRRDGLLTEIDVGGLSEDEVGQLVDQHGAHRDRRQFTHALHAETAGNPFFCLEILRNQADVDTVRTDGRFPLSAGIRHLLQQRFLDLAEPTRELLTMAAVLGRDIDLDTLVVVTGHPDPEVLAALESAVRADLIRETGVGRYTFKHSLVRATLYDALSRTRQARLHAQAATALDAHAGSTRAASGAGRRASAAELAHHYLEAHDPAYLDRAVGFARQAYAEAMAALAYSEAAALHRRTLDAVRRTGDRAGATAGPLLLELGAAQAKTGDLAAARAVFAEAAAVARALGHDTWLATAALGHAGPSWQGFGTVESDTIALIEEALAALGPEQTALRARLMARLAIALYFAPTETARMQELTQTALDSARHLGDDEVLVATLEARLWAQWRPDLVSDRIGTATELVEVATRGGLAEAAATGRRWRVSALLESGDVKQAWAEADRHAADAERLQLPYELMYVAVFATTRAVLEGRTADALAASARVREFGELRGGADAVQFGGVHALTFAYLDGRFGELAPAIAAFAQGYPAVPGWRAALVASLVAGGRSDEALDELERLWPPEDRLPFDAVWLAALGFLSLAVAELGDQRRIRHLLGLLEPYEGRPVVLGAGGAVWGTVDVYLARLEAAVGDQRGAQRRAAAAEAGLRRLGSSLELLQPAVVPREREAEVSP